MTLNQLLTYAQQHAASDLHLYVGKRPIIRAGGRLREIEEQDVLTPGSVQDLAYSVLTPMQREFFDDGKELDVSHEIEGVGRFRINLMWEKNSVGLVARLIPVDIPTMDDLHIPEAAQNFINMKNGLVLITGPAGCGKSTTLASMIDAINNNRGENIITLEDPIEFLFTPNKSIIRQRQLGQDMRSFSESLKYVLRQDPNVIMVGEMRDLETIAATITLAETGHLVFATLHTFSAAETISRIVDVFPPSQQTQIRLQLATTLKGVVSQRLVVTQNEQRIAVREVLLNTPAVATLIRENKLQQIETVLQTNAGKGMCTMDTSVKDLYKKGLISHDEALSYMVHPETLKHVEQDEVQE